MDYPTDDVVNKLRDAFAASWSYKVMESHPGVFMVAYNHGESSLDGTIYKVVPSLATCSCGKWHVNLMPCRHAFACARRVQHWNFTEACLFTCSRVHLNSSCKELFGKRFDMVVRQNIAHDGFTEPNEIMKTAGRNSKVRYRPRSVFEKTGMSTRPCKRCGEPGHYQKTCTVAEKDLPGNSVR